MPFTVQGITPDIIMNPHAVPSRMTIGQLVECCQGKVTSMSGNEGDATAFTDVSAEDVTSFLHKLGFQRHGNETLFNGHTGRKHEAKVFLGPASGAPGYARRGRISRATPLWQGGQRVRGFRSPPCPAITSRPLVIATTRDLMAVRPTTSG